MSPSSQMAPGPPSSKPGIFQPISSTHRCYSFCSAAEDTVNRQARSHPSQPSQPKRCQDMSDKARKCSVLARLRGPSSVMPKKASLLASGGLMLRNCVDDEPSQDAFRDNLIYNFVERDDHTSGGGDDGNRRRVLESEERSGWRSEQGPNP
ncbi:hypothetical protein FVEG_16650 [Fusarium verticillioides 7600]|uniref:Uncharacterized protein n=1 Tax=Gibberella moniliformis (strain M3125 / FGSC 7600) TaxID=334819 RepID=W7MI60_GIBM7|nr:hypothetical protein FVEG_16650 [Fusarium verticillioides 7600]EWG50551.1 hypothetical protein FVEG_16650 [Fusarium verticillioides 7600]